MYWRWAVVIGVVGLVVSAVAVAVDGFDRLRKTTGLIPQVIEYETALKEGKSPAGFERFTGTRYKPSHNEEPSIPPQCWIETSYGTQNACKYCHTTDLARRNHGNAWPLGESIETQVLYSFPSPNLNKVLWDNVIFPDRLVARLRDDEISIPRSGAGDNLRYVRSDNWRAGYRAARPNGDDSWNNRSNPDSPLRLLPALNPDHLYPARGDDASEEGRHGYIDAEGFVRDEKHGYTGWRAVDFFPYAIFTPVGGSVSGIYIRLPRIFMTRGDKVDIEVLRRNLDLLERNIKNRELKRERYLGDASAVPIRRGFYPVETEFAHPLHYVDLAADGEVGDRLDGVRTSKVDYEFPGTRSKRVKEVRYLYKWKEVGLDDIGPKEESAGRILGQQWQGWIDNKSGWILAAYIEDREGELRPQSTEELLQCLGCHSAVGNTIDSVWSFQRKLPGAEGWGEMDYGDYASAHPERTRLRDYRNINLDKGELEYFYWSVVGADLFGVMPAEIKKELLAYARNEKLEKELALGSPLDLIFDDERLKEIAASERRAILADRTRIMRHYADRRAYLYRDAESGEDYIKGSIWYPMPETMHDNIAAYRRIVLDQSFNLGKNTFGIGPDAAPFTFRSDGRVKDANGDPIPVGEIIQSRPWGLDGVGITPTGIASVNRDGELVNEEGEPVDAVAQPENVDGHISQGGTFDTRYNPLLGDPVSKP